MPRVDTTPVGRTKRDAQQRLSYGGGVRTAASMRAAAMAAAANASISAPIVKRDANPTPIPAAPISPHNWRHPAELPYIRSPGKLWDDLAIVRFLAAHAFSIPPRSANTAEPWVSIRCASDGSEVVLPRAYRLPLMWVANYEWTSVKLVLTAHVAIRQREWDSAKFEILHIARLCVGLLDAAKAQMDEGVMEKGWRWPAFDRALRRYWYDWFVMRDEFVRDFWREFGEEEFVGDVLKFGWGKWVLKGHKGFTLTKKEITEGISAETFVGGLVIDESKGTFDWIEGGVGSESSPSEPAPGPSQPPTKPAKKPGRKPPSHRQVKVVVPAVPNSQPGTKSATSSVTAATPMIYTSVAHPTPSSAVSFLVRPRLVAFQTKGVSPVVISEKNKTSASASSSPAPPLPLTPPATVAPEAPSEGDVPMSDVPVPDPNPDPTPNSASRSSNDNGNESSSRSRSNSNPNGNAINSTTATPRMTLPDERRLPYGDPRFGSFSAWLPEQDLGSPPTSESKTNERSGGRVVEMRIDSMDASSQSKSNAQEAPQPDQIAVEVARTKMGSRAPGCAVFRGEEEGGGATASQGQNQNQSGDEDQGKEEDQEYNEEDDAPMQDVQAKKEMMDAVIPSANQNQNQNIIVLDLDDEDLDMDDDLQLLYPDAPPPPPVSASIADSHDNGDGRGRSNSHDGDGDSGHNSDSSASGSMSRSASPRVPPLSSARFPDQSASTPVPPLSSTPFPQVSTETALFVPRAPSIPRFPEPSADTALTRYDADPRLIARFLQSCGTLGDEMRALRAEVDELRSEVRGRVLPLLDSPASTSIAGGTTSANASASAIGSGSARRTHPHPLQHLIDAEDIDVDMDVDVGEAVGPASDIIDSVRPEAMTPTTTKYAEVSGEPLPPRSKKFNIGSGSGAGALFGGF